eukprot:CAMPEP_0175828326 /NCGR_PEP_ID=MMETSP0107_2-20121207/12747_1 /TAXON_ID=195067 ORGANISM="Goniomonas pacifica, Strain CCMP1869" /NCGR_SAMPLE_ID=MMETSP0107_2 /ASSEMBLY_ACC=CAM_ASM_000203 /LENGTH=377 /DNA_ID=CAMNT_0017141041 /DNA_START=213 /DNA_END=1346 /DNA_ORIENTATION=+
MKQERGRTNNSRPARVAATKKPVVVESSDSSSDPESMPQPVKSTRDVKASTSTKKTSGTALKLKGQSGGAAQARLSGTKRRLPISDDSDSSSSSDPEEMPQPVKSTRANTNTKKTSGTALKGTTGRRLPVSEESQDSDDSSDPESIPRPVKSARTPRNAKGNLSTKKTPATVLKGAHLALTGVSGTKRRLPVSDDESQDSDSDAISSQTAASSEGGTEALVQNFTKFLMDKVTGMNQKRKAELTKKQASCTQRVDALKLAHEQKMEEIAGETMQDVDALKKESRDLFTQAQKAVAEWQLYVTQTKKKFTALKKREKRLRATYEQKLADHEQEFEQQFEVVRSQVQAELKKIKKSGQQSRTSSLKTLLSTLASAMEKC